ncbi:hypothetical protein QQ056_06315 [Oscillatoria laete-virens NRMC-F 0139]|nr:hypothetical protein [Oscillatoria laete-virens]MDL5053158.1 hypothetical protein [Oscillatoria laete-virens NRMC-F 0139]
MAELLLVNLVYFGAYLIPIIYFTVTLGRGRAKKATLWGVAIHTFCNLCVWGFVFYSWKAGYSEYYWGWALLIPINIISVIYYLGAIASAHAPKSAQNKKSA